LELIGSFYPDHLHESEKLAGIGSMHHLIQGEIQSVTLERRYIRKDGTSFWGFLSGRRLEHPDGSLRALVGVVTDVSERKQAEETLRATHQKLDLHFQQTPLAVIEWDLAFRVTRWNPAAEAIFGYGSAEATGRHVTFVFPEAVHATIAPLFQALQDGSGGNRLSTENIRKDGRVLQCEWQNTSLSDANGSVVGVISQVDDITERRQAEKERGHLQAQLQQAQKMESMGLLAGGVAHDMNNILGAILGWSSAHLEDQPAGSPTHRAFDTISRAAVRGGKLVNSLLRFSRQSPAEELELDLNEILREDARLLERTTLSRIRLEMTLAADLQPILGDASALTHTFMNLCVNAVDAMPENGTLSLQSRNVDQDWVEVRVEDTGCGMTPDILDKAMDPFFTTKGVGKGTGLGLSMAYSTVKAHRGEIEIHSQPGQGTKVVMRFPGNRVPTTPLAPSGSVMISPAQGSMLVLVVDDDDMSRSATEVMLEILGHQATGVASGEQALAVLEVGLMPNLVILDVNMPGLGGARTLARLHVLRPGLRVLLITGRPEQAVLDLVEAYPNVLLQLKPFGIRDLHQRLEAFGRG
jgi:PAS domain S-box-containing protein